MIARILFLLAFSLFWGGLTFYTGFVVRVSHDVLSDPMDGGLITQRVTEGLQVMGVITVATMVFNCVGVTRHSRKLGYALIGCTLLVACSLVGLFIVHGHLDSVIDAGVGEILDRDQFDTGHRRYNRLTAIQWSASLAYLFITVFAWHCVDTDAGASTGASMSQDEQ